MATKNNTITTTDNTEKSYKAVARQFIKYGGKFIKAEEEFQVKESDVKELKVYADIDIPEESTPPEDTTPPGNTGTGETDKEPGGNGGQ